MPKYITELIGTFFLTLVIGLTVLSSAPMAPLAIGATLMIMVYMGGHVSGGHYNPAVTLAVWIRGKMNVNDAMTYMFFQVAGAILAGITTQFIMGSSLTIAPSASHSIIQALTVEVLFTFALASVVLNVATSKDHPNNSFYGLAIGFTIVVAAFAGGAISGGAFNPAVAIGHNVVSGNISQLWIYLVAPFAGGFLAAGVFRITNPLEYIVVSEEKQFDYENKDKNKKVPAHLYAKGQKAQDEWKDSSLKS